MTTTDTTAPPLTSDAPHVLFALTADEAAGDGLVRIMVEQVDLALWHLGSIGDSDVHVHEVRKASKRLRAVLRMVRDDIGRPAYREVNVIVRDVARELSRVRSCVVQVSVLDDLVRNDGVLAASTEGLRIDLVAAAAEAREDVGIPLAEELAERLDVARSRIVGFRLDIDGPFVMSGTRRTYRRGRAAMADAYATGSPADFHIWRKGVKYLRHQMEVLEGIGPESVGVLVSDLEKIGEMLGADNDLSDLEATMSLNDASSDQEPLIRVIALKRRQIESDIRSSADMVFAASPDTFALSVGGWLG